MFNSLWSSDAIILATLIWDILVQVMSCCLTAPSHYLNQYWLIISTMWWHSSIFTQVYFVGSCWKIYWVLLQVMVSRSGLILCMRPANERWCYNVTSSLIGWAHSQNGPWRWTKTTSWWPTSFTQSILLICHWNKTGLDRENLVIGWLIWPTDPKSLWNSRPQTCTCSQRLSKHWAKLWSNQWDMWCHLQDSQGIW